MFYVPMHKLIVFLKTYVLLVQLKEITQAYISFCMALFYSYCLLL